MRSWLLAFAVVTAVPVVAHLQAPADFSGTWTLDVPPVAGTPAVPGVPATVTAPGDLGSGWGPSLTIRQDAARVVVEDPVFSRYDLQPPLVFTYPLDGSAARTAVMVGRGEQVQTSRARWQGSSLEIVTTFQVADPAVGPAFAFDVTRRLSIEASATLVVETTRAGALGGSPSTTRAVYRRR